MEFFDFIRANWNYALLGGIGAAMMQLHIGSIFLMDRKEKEEYSQQISFTGILIIFLIGASFTVIFFEATSTDAALLSGVGSYGFLKALAETMESPLDRPIQQTNTAIELKKATHREKELQKKYHKLLEDSKKKIHPDNEY